MKMQKLGGWSLIVMLCVTVVYIAIVVPLARQYDLNLIGATLDPAKVMALYSGSTTTVKILFPFGILIGILYLLISLAIQERMQAKAPNLMRLLVIAASVAFALRLAGTMIAVRGYASMIGVQDISIYRPLLAMLNGINTAAEHAWGWAILLIALGAISTGALPRLLAYIILVCGIYSVIEFSLPSATGTVGAVVGIIFLVLNIIGVIWLAVVLIKKPEPALA